MSQQRHINKRWTEGEYRGALKRIRHYTGDAFSPSKGYDLRKFGQFTPYQKSQIRKYAEGITGLTSGQATYPYRPRKKSRLRDAREYRGVGDLTKLKVIPIESRVDRVDIDTGEIVVVKPKISFKKGFMRVDLGGGLVRDTLDLGEMGIDRDDFISDPIGIFESVISEYDYTYYSIIAGSHEVKQGGVPKLYMADELLAEIGSLVENYSDEESNSFFGNWLFGVKGYIFNKLGDIDSWEAAQKSFINRRSKIRALIKSSKAKIDKHNEEKTKIKRAKRLSPKNLTIVRSALNARAKDANKKQLGAILKLRKIATQNKNKKIPNELKDFVISYKNDAIKHQNRRIDALILSRSRSVTSKK